MSKPYISRTRGSPSMPGGDFELYGAEARLCNNGSGVSIKGKFGTWFITASKKEMKDTPPEKYYKGMLRNMGFKEVERHGK
jgi:hypothetical protein